RVVGVAEVQRRADPAGETALGDRDQEAALGDVVRARQRTRADGLADRVLPGADLVDVDRIEAVGQRSPVQLRQLARGEPGPELTRERDRVALASEAEAPGPPGVGQATDHADDRRRVDRAGGGLVVERDVAAD